MYKKCKVVMLPTNKKAPVFLYHLDNNKSGIKFLALTLDRQIYSSYKFQHLYILSGDSIKEGEWCYQTVIQKIIQCPFDIKSQDKYVGDHRYEKVIASTDSSLKVKFDYPTILSGNLNSCLPSPSQSFIDKYISKYNKGNKIEEVMVEYEQDIEPKGSGSMWSDEGDFIMEYLKINSKDNTITIKTTKDSWTRDEVIELMDKYFKSYEFHTKNFYKWIESNL